MLLRMCFIIQGGNHVVKRTIFPVTGEVHLTPVSTSAVRPGVSRTEHTMSSAMSCDMMIMMVMVVAMMMTVVVAMLSSVMTVVSSMLMSITDVLHAICRWVAKAGICTDVHRGPDTQPHPSTYSVHTHAHAEAHAVHRSEAAGPTKSRWIEETKTRHDGIHIDFGVVDEVEVTSICRVRVVASHRMVLIIRAHILRVR